MASETIPDYRPKDVFMEKNKKTSTNQSTKFQELQHKFGNVANDISDDIPLIKQFNTIGDNINTENEVSISHVSFSDCVFVKH